MVGAGVDLLRHTSICPGGHLLVLRMMQNDAENPGETDTSAGLLWLSLAVDPGATRSPVTQPVQYRRGPKPSSLQ